MPGPVSDAYDPEFGTAAVADEVREAIQEVVCLIGGQVGDALAYIVDIARAKNGKKLSLRLSERQWRLVRFALLREIDSL